MGTTIYIRLQDGRRVRFGRAPDVSAAERVMNVVAGWVREGMSLSLADAGGQLEEVLARTVQGFELTNEATPAQGSARIKL
jgi:hypothetical protein